VLDHIPTALSPAVRLRVLLLRVADLGLQRARTSCRTRVSAPTVGVAESRLRPRARTPVPLGSHGFDSQQRCTVSGAIKTALDGASRARVVGAERMKRLRLRHVSRLQSRVSTVFGLPDPGFRPPARSIKSWLLKSLPPPSCRVAFPGAASPQLSAASPVSNKQFPTFEDAPNRYASSRRIARRVISISSQNPFCESLPVVSSA